MNLYHLISGPLNVNTYFLVDEKTKNAVVIDSGENYNAVKKLEQEKGIKIIAVLLTHAHFDHAGNVKKLQNDGVKIYCSEVDSKKLLNDENLGKRFGRHVEKCVVDKTFSDGDVLTFDSIELKVIETKGHTDGSVTFLFNDMLFTGDTLFYDTVGRTDFITGNREEMVASIQKLFSLEGDYNVYPGHGQFTTLDRERMYNDYAEYE